MAEEGWPAEREGGREKGGRERKKEKGRKKSRDIATGLWRRETRRVAHRRRDPRDLYVVVVKGARKTVDKG